MIPQEFADLLTSRTNAIVALNRVSGGPQLSPVWFVWDEGAFYFRVAKDTAKYRNILRNRSISLMIYDTNGFRYLVAYGDAIILDHNPRDVAVQIVHKYYAPALASQRMPAEQEPDVVTIQLSPEKILTVVETIAQEAVESWAAAKSDS